MAYHDLFLTADGRSIICLFSADVTYAYVMPKLPFMAGALWLEINRPRRRWTGGVGTHLPAGCRQAVYLLRCLAILICHCQCRKRFGL